MLRSTHTNSNKETQNKIIGVLNKSIKHSTNPTEWGPIEAIKVFGAGLCKRYGTSKANLTRCLCPEYYNLFATCLQAPNSSSAE